MLRGSLTPLQLRLLAPQEAHVQGVSVLVDTPQEILTNKLCALLSRGEYRDLVDTRWLLEHGGDLERAVQDAPQKDGGFSASVLAWVLTSSNLGAMARTVGAEADEVAALALWRDGFVKRLLSLSHP